MFGYQDILTKEITSIIKALKTKNSHGFDEISINY